MTRLRFARPDRVGARRLRWRRHRAVGVALIVAVTVMNPGPSPAQVGQTPLGPASGLVNGAVARLAGPDSGLPGVLYYGVNAADRGLGYRGSYMTLGGFIPAFEDDLGGFWSADLRGHLSVYGGFFSNVGAVRKQFIGGTLLGVGVYWDYDGDLNQYSPTSILGTPYSFAGGQVYNQVGISGEWLTDWGNLRSNGYIPVGTTAQLVGPFVGNVVLCEPGINAGLGGADLEVGAYIPGLADWAGMISVGGYAFGNTRYQFPNGDAAVPWFGGVYTRLDMTFLRGWDFSLQANNDSYFDWTGFARLTYRMGGSRRRNVPDQVEQPMMRNEHIVRAYQQPVVATNPNNVDSAGNPLPWRVIHVDNSVATSGNGSAESPFTTLGAANAAATAAYDIVYVHQGNSVTDPYVTAPAGYLFNAANQYLVGQGGTLTIPTVTCGDKSFFADGGATGYPVLTNPVGPAIVLNQPNVTVSHLSIVNSPLGFGDAPGGSGTVSDVIITGNSLGPQRGVFIANSTGPYTFDRMQLRDLDDDGFVIAADDARVKITRSSITNTIGDAVRVSGSNAQVAVATSRIDGTGGTAVAVAGPASLAVLASSTITNTFGNAVVASGSEARVAVRGVVIKDTTGAALAATGIGATITATNSTIDTTGSNAVVLTGSGSRLALDNSLITDAGINGILVAGSRAALFVTNGSQITQSNGNGIQVTGADTRVLVRDSTIAGSSGNGVQVTMPVSSTSTQVTILRSTINQSSGFGVTANGVGGDTQVVQVYGSTISNAGTGISAINSNIDVGRDPTVINGMITEIQNAGPYGVRVNGYSRARVTDANISGVGVGISAGAAPPAGFISGVNNPALAVNLTATGNTISSGTTGVEVVGYEATTTTPRREAFSLLRTNQISTTGSTGIVLETRDPPAAPAVAGVIRIREAGDAAELGAFNFGTIVGENPVDQVFYSTLPAPPPLLPPTPAVLTPP